MADFTIKNIFIFAIIAGLVVSVLGALILALGENNDLTGYDKSDLELYTNYSSNISAAVNKTYADVSGATIDSAWFDFLSGIWNKILAPFKFMFSTVITLISLLTVVVENLKLLGVFGSAATSILIIYIIFRILKHYNIIKK